jgi:hypothetical protein
MMDIIDRCMYMIPVGLDRSPGIALQKIAILMMFDEIVIVFSVNICGKGIQTHNTHHPCRTL